MIKIYLDTNILYADKNRIFKNPEFGGEYASIIKLKNILNKYREIVKLYVPKVSIMEFKHNCVEQFIIERKKIDEYNNALLSIYGENLIHKTTLKWKNCDEYSNYLNNEITRYIDNNKHDFEVIDVPNCLEEIVDRAIKKQPLFKEVKSGNKTYYDAGFKDNLILETCKSNLTYNDIGIIFTKDSDFGIQFDNIFIARTRDELETIIREHCPDYIIMKLIEKVDTESKKIDLLSILDKDNNSNLRIVDFSNEQIEYDEEEDIFTFFVFANIDDQLQKIKITYNEYMDSIDYAEMLE